VLVTVSQAGRSLAAGFARGSARAPRRSAGRIEHDGMRLAGGQSQMADAVALSAWRTASCGTGLTSGAVIPRLRFAPSGCTLSLSLTLGLAFAIVSTALIGGGRYARASDAEPHSWIAVQLRLSC
jgi:hypothetical protein